MWWLTKVIVLAALQYAGGIPRFPHDDFGGGGEESTGVLQQEESPEYAAARLEDEKLEQLENFLGELIMMPWNGKSPLLYIEDGRFDEEQEMAAMPYKRSRYYRKYPWKRQNSRRNTGGTRYFCTQDKEKGFKGAVVYDAENPYLCTPSKDDVVRLLVALHEARGGTRGRTVDFCNRKRPASSIFTNIRFLG